jgi:hypothetical protein
VRLTDLGRLWSRATVIDNDQIQLKGAAHVPLARILRRPNPDE